MREIELSTADVLDEDITVELSPGYDVMADSLAEKYESEEQMFEDLCRTIETIVFQEISSQADGPEIHLAVAELLLSLEETNEVDIQVLTENSIHQMRQAFNQVED